MKSIVSVNARGAIIDRQHRALTSMGRWPLDDFPREKLINKGISSLSDAELIAILLNTGSKGKSAMNLAQEILTTASYSLNELGKFSFNQLKRIKGIGIAKAAILLAAIEVGRRRQAGSMLPKKTIVSGKDAALYFKPLLGDQQFESFHVLFLNQASKVIANRCISIGGITFCPADVRIILKEALDLNATQLILCHNHLSGSLNAGQADQMFTNKIMEGARLLDIYVKDHIVVSFVGYYSFREESFIKF
ncbi:DNA repair protein RadC [Chitinophaga sancti]|uniref:RadC family protein n=1 Tax=Chitinophaga sancti TaxID=1004 RepID=UPI002A747998|nr:DNA repair protein RadC [Chitinophaga sancti]WPQ61229.1 DNA repair protein RadC [Chitinophaga sancti]